MKKITLIVIATLFLIISSNTTYAGSTAGNFSVGLGPVGNIFVVDSNPELDPGVGGYVYFDYRWSPQFSTQFGVMVTTEDGTGISAGDNGIEFLGIPTFDLKFYVLSSPSRWDPYGMIGIGFYAVSEGSADNGTVAFGIGANLGLGFDFYLTEKFSLGFATVLRSIGMIDSIGGNSNGTSLFPVSLQANVAYHF
ncbi:MAG: outer membrane beta-barrel protein [Pseudomonadota bacterium]